MMNDEYYIALIQKEQTEGLSNEEREGLDHWLDSNPDHKKLYQEILSVLNLTDDYEIDVEIDLDNDFAKVKSKIESTATSSKQAKTVRLRPFIGIAASLLLLMAVFVGNGLLGDPDVQFAASVNNEKITFPDGSIAKLKKGSTISYDEDWDKSRRVRLKGSAYFDVVTNNTKPFVIEGESSMVTVLGTRFIYESKGETGYVDMLEGKVRLDVGNESAILTKEIEPTAVFKDGKIEQTTNQEIVASWYVHEFEYNDEPLSVIVSELSDWHDRIIDLPETLGACTFSGKLDKDDISKALDTLAKALGVNLLIEGKRYTFVGDTCK